MDKLSTLHAESSREEVITALEQLFTPYATELINSGADFSYMNMYADNFMQELIQKTSFSEYEIYGILNEVCELCWRNQVNN